MANADKYGRLTITSQPFRKFPLPTSNQKRYYVSTLCDCGAIKNMLWDKIKTGQIVSCGCHKMENLNNGINTSHGFSKHPLCYIFNGMIQRCYNQKNPAYKNYGERGITICNEWMNDNKLFFDWALSSGWGNGLEIDRKNNAGNYEPSNCHFITSTWQNRNKRNIKMTVESVLNIRQLYSDGMANRKQLAYIYNINVSSVAQIVTNKSWIL